jgi:hypothetical protein
MITLFNKQKSQKTNVIDIATFRQLLFFISFISLIAGILTWFFGCNPMIATTKELFFNKAEACFYFSTFFLFFIATFYFKKDVENIKIDL